MLVRGVNIVDLQVARVGYWNLPLHSSVRRGVAPVENILDKREYNNKLITYGA
jgi:hypothetical protein